jgi:aspartyl-tRNA(Asn)/glutamyl-tRNA(Gln) amidotransferase subunit C
MAHLTRDDVERVAALARLSLSEQEAARMASELETVLAYAESLNELDTRGVEPTAHALPLATPMREDREEPPLDPELALANAPERAGTAFVVPRVLEGEEEG